MSGLHINWSKSAIYIAGLSEDSKAYVLDAIGVPKGQLPFRYLGFPLLAKRLSVHDCLPIVDKITASIMHWTSRNLSMARRVQFVSSVVHAMLSYWAQIFLLPCNINSMVGHICEKFIWHIDDSLGAKSKVAWKQVYNPKAYGELSICNIKAWNDVVLLKSLWALASKKDRL